MKFELSDRYDSKRRTLTIGKLQVWWPFPIVASTSSSAAVVLGWRVYGAKAPKFIKLLHRVARYGHKVKWKFLHRYVKRYQFNVIRTDLEPGYYDIDHLMLHACMKLVRRYVEDEIGGEDKLNKFNRDLRESPDPNEPTGASAHQAERQEGVLEVYRWWMYDRLKDHARRDALLHRLYGKGRMKFVPTENPNLSEMVFEPYKGEEIAMREEYRALQDKIAEDETHMLHRAVDLRGGMWT